jgi:hypothetical protein
MHFKFLTFREMDQTQRINFSLSFSIPYHPDFADAVSEKGNPFSGTDGELARRWRAWLEG